MKKILLLASFLTLLFSNAQEIKLGAKAGMNVANLTNLESNSSRSGFYAGAYARIPISSSKFSIQPEVLYSMQGAKASDSYASYSYSGIYSGYIISVDEDVKCKFNYINVPVMLQYELIPGLRAEFGPQFGFAINKKVKGTFKSYIGNNLIAKTSVSEKMNIKTFDFGLNIGTSYELKNGLNFSARYAFGLTNVAGSSKNSVFSFGVGYTFKTL